MSKTSWLSGEALKRLLPFLIIFNSLLLRVNSNVQKWESGRISQTGTVYTKSGYDREGGSDPVCWKSKGTTSEVKGLNSPYFPYVWHTDFALNFYAGETQTLAVCPEHFVIDVEAPPHGIRDESGHMMTGTMYEFQVHLEISVDSLRRALSVDENYYFYSELYEEAAMNIKPRLSLQVIFCRISTAGGGICSPFVYQHDYEYGDSHIHDNEETHNTDPHRHGGATSGSDDSEDHSFPNLFKEKKVKYSSNSDNSSDEDSGDSGDGEDGKEHAFFRSQPIFVNLPSLKELTDSASELGDDDLIIRVDRTVPVTMTQPETVFAIAVARFLFSNETNFNTVDETQTYPTSDAVTFKFDASNIIPERALVYNDPPVVGKVSRKVEIFSYVLIAIISSAELFMLLSMIKHSSNSVFKLSQGIFLMAFVSAAILASTSSFLFNPKNDVYCNAQGPLIMIPAQLMISIIAGRLWRIITVMSPLMDWANHDVGSNDNKNALKRFGRLLPSYLRNNTGGDGDMDTTASSSQFSHGGSMVSNTRKRNTTKLKRTVTKKQLIVVIIGLTLPQVLLQIVLLAVAPLHHTIKWNDDRSFGRYHCHSERTSVANWLPYVLMLLTMFLLLFVAFRSRNLPSLFNEAESMFSSAVSTAAASVIAIAILFVADTPESNPDVSYIVRVALILYFTVDMSFRLIYPKLKLVWNGEKIAVSTLVKEHAAKKKKSSIARASLVAKNFTALKSQWNIFGSGGIDPAAAGGGGGAAAAAAAAAAANSSSATSTTSGVAPTQTTLSPGFTDTSETFGAGVATESMSDNAATADTMTPTTPTKEEDEEMVSEVVKSNRRLSPAPSFSSFVERERSVNILSSSKKTNSTSSIESSNETAQKSSVKFADDVQIHVAPRRPDKPLRGSMWSTRSVWKKLVSRSTREVLAGNLYDHDEEAIAEGEEQLSNKRKVWESSNHGFGFDKSTLTEDDEASASASASIYISEDRPCPKIMLVKLLQMNALASKSNKKIMSGLQLNRRDWENLRNEYIQMGKLFQDEVKLEWEMTDELANTT